MHHTLPWTLQGMSRGRHQASARWKGSSSSTANTLTSDRQGSAAQGRLDCNGLERRGARVHSEGAIRSGCNSCPSPCCLQHASPCQHLALAYGARSGSRGHKQMLSKALQAVAKSRCAVHGKPCPRGRNLQLHKDPPPLSLPPPAPSELHTEPQQSIPCRACLFSSPHEPA